VSEIDTPIVARLLHDKDGSTHTITLCRTVDLANSLKLTNLFKCCCPVLSTAAAKVWSFVRCSNSYAMDTCALSQWRCLNALGYSQLGSVLS
jgi:hypothetical protein